MGLRVSAGIEGRVNPIMSKRPRARWTRGVTIVIASALSCCGLIDAEPLDGGRTTDGEAGYVGADTAYDAGVDAACDAGRGMLAPRLIAPLSTSRVTRRRPTLRWSLPDGVTDVTVDLCFDRACRRPIGAPTQVTGSSFTPANDLPVGVVFWRVHPSTACVTSATWELTVGAGHAAVDTSWGTTLDVNGDGYGDLVVGSGSAGYVYLGGPSGLATTPATTIPGSPCTEGYVQSGSSISAGDVNGDGYSDLIVGQASTTSANTPPGMVVVYLGSASGLGSAPSATLFGPESTQPHDGFGDSVSGAEDVNGDGYADVIVADPVSGYAYVFLGGASGPATTPVITLVEPGIAAGNVESVVNGGFAFSLAGVGDVNGDGYADVVVDEFTDCFMSQPSYLYLGGATGISPAPTATIAGPKGSGEEFCGTIVVGAGDVNGDGYADVAVSTWGLVSVYLGSATGLAAVPTSALTALSESNPFSGFPLASAGDVNGDGFADVVVAVGATVDGYPSNAYVYLGGATGLSAVPAAVLPGGHGGLHFVAGAGDLNGDGFADVVLGSPGTGTATIFLGGPSGVSPANAMTLTGPAGGGFGWCGFGATN